MKKEMMLGLFAASNIEVLRYWQIENMYWPDDERYYNIRKENPWWLVKTKKGLIRIGNRKRVISINWEDTDIRTIVTSDEVSKDDDMVHAWSNAKAVEYLSSLSYWINQSPHAERDE